MKIIYDETSVTVDQLKPHQIKQLLAVIDQFIEDQFRLAQHKQPKDTFVQKLVDVACKEYLNQCEEHNQLVLKDITPDNAIQKVLQAVYNAGTNAKVYSIYSHLFPCVYSSGSTNSVVAGNSDQLCCQKNTDDPPSQI